MTEEEHRCYSKGYNKGRTTGRNESAIEIRELKARIRALERQAAMPPTVERSSDAHLLVCLADRIPKAIEHGRIAAWEKAGISIIEFIASQYGSATERKS